MSRARGSQMTSHTSIIGHGRRKRGGFRWEQHGAPLDAFSRLACQSELELAKKIAMFPSGALFSDIFKAVTHNAKVRVLHLAACRTHVRAHTVCRSSWMRRLMTWGTRPLRLVRLPALHPPPLSLSAIAKRLPRCQPPPFYPF